MADQERDEEYMVKAFSLAESVRATTSPNPWVGALIVFRTGKSFGGATSAPGGSHAEICAIENARQHQGEITGDFSSATLYSTLEPCTHFGRTPPCTNAIIEAGISRVVLGVVDPDPKVLGRGIKALKDAGISVSHGVLGDQIREQLAPYLKHRSTGRPFVVLKMAASIDGRSAAPNGSSRWITGEAARRDVHLLRSRSDAVLVGAGTIRADDPELTARTDPPQKRQPRRVVLGEIPKDAKVHPATTVSGPLDQVLDKLGSEGVLQLLVEGGAHVAHDFHVAGLVDRYVIYLAPAIFGGDDARSMFAGKGAQSIEEFWRGEIISVDRLGVDLRIEISSGQHRDTNDIEVQSEEDA